MRIRPGTRVGRDEAGRVVIGEGSQRRRMERLSPVQAEVLERLLTGRPLPSPAPGSRQVNEYAQLLGALKPWLEETDPARCMPGLAAERLRPDARSWAQVWGQVGRPAGERAAPAEEVMFRRTRASVWISTLDRTGVATAMALAAAGVGRIAAPHDGVVVGEDLGTSPLRLTELGLPRTAGLARHLARLYPHSHVLSPVHMAEAVHGVDAVVLMTAHGLNADQLLAVADADVPVLPVVRGANGFQIGPAVGIGERCTTCAMAQWPSLGVGDEEVGVASPSETTTAVTVAGLVAQSVLMMLDAVCTPRVAQGALVGSMVDGGVDFVQTSHHCARRRAA
ncbi:hypothetical protein [Galactobacter sp.]|uniref:hypothetical protein n=1 Tax=Galactobacter sp. TaxID=2676125 RepID=UPI0025BBF8E4|nr:hypothetical protein [Galactobacter sp.]